MNVEQKLEESKQIKAERNQNQPGQDMQSCKGFINDGWDDSDGQ